MKRSAVLAGAVAVAIGAIDCSSSSTPEKTHDSGTDVVAPVTDYGIPGPFDAAPPLPPPVPDAAADVVAPIQEYGIPPITVDAGYGIPAFDAGTDRPDVLAGGTDYGIPPSPGSP